VPQTLQAKRFTVSGMVQGVGFRFFAQRVAERLGVAGYAKNLRDGRVEIYAIGTPEQLRELRAELERGPRHASVSGVAEEDAEVESHWASGFTIEHDWSF
jgi:acylphosphatase